jgi:predicted MFS family arabinose efflux permease
VVFASATIFWVAWLALAVMGAADAISVVIRMTLLQIETPDDMRGRVSAVNSLFTSMSNQIGDFRAGVMAALIGAVPAVLVGGIGTLLTVLLCIRLFPALYRIESYRRPP